ncbi:peptidase S41 family protein [Colletotrichum tofieldiae]|nr:peptidase S41 family protein [Colletotrichum tofieldiae]
MQFSGYQDADTQWNAQFKSGKERSEDSSAFIRPGVNFTGVNSGEDYYNRFCNPNNLSKPASLMTGMMANQTSPSLPSASGPPPPPKPTIEGYPFPVVRDSGANTLSGYFLNGSGYDDVAVLAVSSFNPPDTGDPIEYINNFQNTVATFLAKSKKAGKKRLVVDVAANGGGFVNAGYDLFAQASNLRLSEGITDLARFSASILANFKPTTPEEKDALASLGDSPILSNFVPGAAFTPYQQAFVAVDQILAPVALNGDVFSAYFQVPLNKSSPSFNLTGVGSKANPPARVFEPENVVLFTDGTCGSTCTLFSYLMILQMGIKTTVIGGRPNTGIMQSIAGVEGAQSFTFNDITIDAKSVIALTPKDKKEKILNSELGELAKGYALKRAQSPETAGSINARNAFSMADARTPLQFT